VAQQGLIQFSEPTFYSVYFAIVGVHTCTHIKKMLLTWCCCILF